MKSGGGISRLQDASDVNVTLEAGVDGYVLSYDHDTGKFVLKEDVVDTGITEIQDADDVNFSLGAGVDEYAVCYDHDTGKFVLRLVTQGSCLLATGVTTGATSQAQTFTNGLVLGENKTITSSKGICIEETGDTYGTSRLYIQNRDGINGAMFETTSTTITLIDFVFKTYLHQRNVRLESRSSYCFFGSAPEFQIGRPSAGNIIPNTATFPALVVSDAKINVTAMDAGTNTVSPVIELNHFLSSGSAAAGHGSSIVYYLETSTSYRQPAASIEALANDATNATRKFDLVFSAYDTAKREGIRIRGAGSAVSIGFFGATPTAKAAHIAALKVDYAAGDLDSEAEIISAINATNMAINAIIVILENLGFKATA